jgi:hypothetical protein
MEAGTFKIVDGKEIALTAEEIAEINERRNTPQVIPVPQVLTPLQFRKALRASGLHQQFMQIISTLDEESQETVEYATEFHIDNPLMETGMQAMNKTREDLENIFRLGVTF